MKIGAIVQSRMNSERLPGKVLLEVFDKPLLQYLIERLKNCSLLDSIVVATSDQDSDNPLAEFCENKGLDFCRGPLNDVAGRFMHALDVFNFDVFVRVNGDSPLLDQKLIDKGIEILVDSSYEMVTNVLVRTYPKGQSVEIIKSEVFKKAYQEMSENDDLEHVTKYFYRNKDNFNIFNFESQKNLGAINLSVDTPQDFKKFSKVITRMNKPHWEYALEDILSIYSYCDDEIA